MASYKTLIKENTEAKEQHEDAKESVQEEQMALQNAQNVVQAAQLRVSRAATPEERVEAESDLRRAEAKERQCAEQLREAETQMRKTEAKAKEQVIETQNEVQRKNQNAQKYQKLQVGSFGANADYAVAENIKAMNELIDSKAELQESLGQVSDREYAKETRSGNSGYMGAERISAATVAGETAVENQFYDSKINDFIMNPEVSKEEKMKHLAAIGIIPSEELQQLMEQIDIEATLKSEEEDPVKVKRMSEEEKWQWDRRAIDSIVEVTFWNLYDAGFGDDPRLQEYLDAVRGYYLREAEKKRDGLANNLDDGCPNPRTIMQLGPNYMAELMSRIHNCPDEDCKKLYDKFLDKITISTVKSDPDKNFYKRGDGIYLNFDVSMNGNACSLPYEIFFHEAAHNIDNMFCDSAGTYLSESWGNNVLGKALVLDYKRLIKDQTSEELVNSLKQEQIRNGWKEPQVASLSDMLECFTGIDYPLGVGHNKIENGIRTVYWEYVTPNVEFFAEVLSAKMTNPEGYAIIKDKFPNAVDVVNQMIKDVVNKI